MRSAPPSESRDVAVSFCLFCLSHLVELDRQGLRPVRQDVGPPPPLQYGSTVKAKGKRDNEAAYGKGAGKERRRRHKRAARIETRMAPPIMSGGQGQRFGAAGFIRRQA